MNQKKDITIRIRKHLSRYVQMLIRCYDPNCKSYKNYGGKGVSVCDEWLKSPDSFIQWCEENGYDENKVLDKDILCDKLNIYPKIYSPETCIFISQKENMQHVLDNTLYQAVACYDDNGNLVKEYKSISEVKFDGKQVCNVSRVVRQKRAKAHGYYWIYIDKIGSAPAKIKIPEKKILGIKIQHIDENGNLLKIYGNAKEAAKDLNFTVSSVCSVANGNRNSLFGNKFIRV